METHNENLDNDEILQVLENETDDIRQDEQDEQKIKIILFSLDEHLFGIDSALIREIITDYSVFFLPFAPPYIRGLLNRHGDPHTVIDLHQLLYNEKLQGSVFLVYRDDVDHFCFLISKILKIISIPVTDIHTIKSNDSENEQIVFRNSITYNNQEIFLIDVDSILKRISHELA